MTAIPIPPLQPLRIPTGWTVVYNDFREVDPSPEAYEDDLLREDLLQLAHSRSLRVIDLGWYGLHGSFADGAYGVVCVEKDDLLCWTTPLETVKTRDRLAAVAAVERLLEENG